MALTIKKTKSGLMLPNNYLGSYSTPHIDEKIESIINEAIKNILHQKLGNSSASYVKKIIYFPVYTYDKYSKEKTINSIYIKIKTRVLPFIKITADEIEYAGVNLIEFFDYIMTGGAKEIMDAKISFEEV